MKRFLYIILTLALALNLAASAAVTAAPCHKPCCERELASQIDRACTACGPSVGEPAMPCCNVAREAGAGQATLNTGSILPNFDVASIAGETPVRFTCTPARHPANQTFGAYESPPIFILNASFIC